LGAVAAPQGETRPVRLTNRLRNLAAGALASHLILSDNVTEQLPPRTLQREATPAMAALLQQRLQAETDDNVRVCWRWRWRACSSLSLRPARGWPP
jgi:urea transport system permease protein